MNTRSPAASGSGMLKPLLLVAMSALGLSAGAATVEVELRSPLNTFLRCNAPNRDGTAKRIEAVIDVPADAPADLGVGAFITDRHGRWFQRCRPGTLSPGRHRLSIRISPLDSLINEPGRAGWTTTASAVSHTGGLFFWSIAKSRARISCSSLSIATDEDADVPGRYALADVSVSGLGADGCAQVRTGERWIVNLRPLPFPANPYDAEEFSLDASIVSPDGTTHSVPGFYLQPMDHHDRGDSELVMATAAAHFEVRFRARQPGRHHVTLQGRWRDRTGATHAVSYACPQLIADGPAWDDYVRVDGKDPRFFSVGGACFWPIGLNLHAIRDLRAQEQFHTRLTPNRGLLSYDAYLRRLAAAGGTCTEIWMSSWNLGLEWRADWLGFHGQGRYNEENAWRLDRVLDLADGLGIRVNLVINNHGQGSVANDHEWEHNPHGTQHGGKLRAAHDLFRDAWALSSQERMRRYIVARYADHPSVLAWKLWSEINLTTGGSFLKSWHDQASQRWHALDIYQHPVTTHWSGDYQMVDRAIVALPGIDFTCIDAYQPGQRHNAVSGPLADLIAQGVKSLGTSNKPLLVTECGGHWDGCPEPALLADHRSSGWAALVTGNAGQPLLWWSEWVDQKNLWQPYQALSGFTQGEDLRSPSAKSVTFSVIDAVSPIWARAWSRPGRMLGYLLDSTWGMSGAEPPAQDLAKVRIGSGIASGKMRVEWWDADIGVILTTADIDHPGGELVISAPSFQRHVAFKLYRSQPAQ